MNLDTGIQRCGIHKEAKTSSPGSIQGADGDMGWSVTNAR